MNAIEQLAAKRNELQQQLIQTNGHLARSRIMKAQADIMQDIYALAYKGMTQRQEYIALTIISHMQRRKRVPNYATIHTTYAEGEPVFELLRSNGAMRWTKKPSKTGRMMTTLELTF
jgi:hypothetical protein